MKRLLACGALALTFGLVAGAPVGAESHKLTIPLTCGAKTYQVVVGGNGEWTPARDTASNLVFHPTAFGEFHGTFTPSDGSPPQSETEPPVSRKTTPANGRPTLSCTFTVHFQDDGGTFVGSGSVSGWTSGNAKG